MIFLKKSLITITILVVAIWVMPAISDDDKTAVEGICKEILQIFCDFKNTEQDSEGNVRDKLNNITQDSEYFKAYLYLIDNKYMTEEAKNFIEWIFGGQHAYGHIDEQIIIAQESEDYFNRLIRGSLHNTSSDYSSLQGSLSDLQKQYYDKAYYKNALNRLRNTPSVVIETILKNYSLHYMTYLSNAIRPQDLAVAVSSSLRINCFCSSKVNVNNLKQFFDFLLFDGQYVALINDADILNTNIKDLATNLF